MHVKNAQPNAADFEPGLVSIVVPTYNRAEFLLEALDSIRAQTYKKTQIIVVDDGSTDNTRELVSAMPDVKYVYQANQRQAAARNAGLKYATGEYLCSLDSDDIWKPQFLERSLEALQTLDVDFVFSNSANIDPSGKRYRSFFERGYRWWDFKHSDCFGWRLMEPPAVRAMYLDMCVSPSSALLMRRSTVETYGWASGLHIADDGCLLLDIVLNKPTRIAFTMFPLWIKRVDGDNICDSGDRVEFVQKLFINDAQTMFSRHYELLTDEERAFLLGRIAFNYAAMTLLRTFRGQWKAVPMNALLAVQTVMKTAKHSPRNFIKFIRRQ